MDAAGLKESICSKLIYLEDQSVEINGVKIYGSPWQPLYHDWAFQLEKGEQIKRMWDLIPPDVDVLLTHGPPTGTSFIIDTP